MNPTPVLPRALALFLLALPGLAEPSPASAGRLAQDGKADTSALIERGRSLLEEGKPAEARAEFARAHELAPGPATRMWVLRGALTEGKALEVLAEVDSLALPEADRNYLRGMALYTKAKSDIAKNAANAFTDSQISDAAEFLGEATRHDGARYRDAWLPLADAAWLSQKLELAAGALTKALERQPADPKLQLLRGQIALSRFVAAHPGAQPSKELAQDPHWKLASESFAKAAELAAAAGDTAGEVDAHVQLGNAWLWIDSTGAREPYAAAMAADPARVPFGQVAERLGPEGFGAAVELGSERFDKRHPDGHPGAALMAWWTGYGLFGAKKLAEAEQAFRRAVELQPSFSNSWFYVFRASYDQQAFDRAVEALERGYDSGAEGFAQILQGDKEFNLRVIEFLVGWCADGRKHGGRVLRESAARLSELAALTSPTDSRFWNNMGLFLRDHAEGLYRTRKPENKAPAMAFWEKAYVAYGKALALEPENPVYLNDTAVMLHYYLQRDLERAKQMYLDAGRLAGEGLKRSDLSPEDRELLKVAERDAGNNLRNLERRLKEIAEGTAREREPGDQD